MTARLAIAACFLLAWLQPAAAPAGAPGAVGLHGIRPKKTLPAPEFGALNRDGSARARADLVGHPTVLWFYPKAGTPG